MGTETQPRWMEPVLATLLILGYGWFFVYFARHNNPNENVRLYMVRALVEQGRYAIAERVPDGAGGLVDEGPLVDQWGPVNDRALVCHDPAQRPPACAGTLYSVKAPGASFLAVPIYAVQRAVFRRIASRDPTMGEMLWPLRVLLVSVPTVLLWLALRRFLVGRGVDAWPALLVTLAGGLGSLSLTYGQLFAGHQLAALGLGAAFLAAFSTGQGHDARRGAALGLGLGLASACEYQAAPGAAILLLFALRQRSLGWLGGLALAAAALPFAVAVAHFHTACFGAPWRTPYGFHENPEFAALDASAKLFSNTWPSLQSVAGSLWGPYLGLWFWAPWTALALVAPFYPSPASSPQRRVSWTAATVVGYFLLFQITSTIWRSGWSVGPRYITPLVPFAAVLIGLALARCSGARRTIALGVVAGGAAASIAATGLASAVSRGFPKEFFNPLVEVVGPLLRHGWLPPNLLQHAGVGGLKSGAPYLAALAVAVGLVLLAPLHVRDTRRSMRVLGVVLALALFVALTTLQWSVRAPWPKDRPLRERAQAFARLTAAFQPSPPLGATNIPIAVFRGAPDPAPPTAK